MNQSIADKVNKFFATYELKYLEKNEMIITPGSKVDSVFYLISGNVRHFKTSSKGNDVVLNIYRDGAFFPMSLAINQTPSLHYYKTNAKVLLRQAPSQDVVEFLQDNPDVMFDLLRRVFRGTEGLLDRLAFVMDSSARVRIIHELTVQAKRFGKPTPKGIDIRITEQELADQTGLTRETVSREISSLKKNQLIVKTSGNILVTDISNLEKELEASDTTKA